MTEACISDFAHTPIGRHGGAWATLLADAPCRATLSIGVGQGRAALVERV